MTQLLSNICDYINEKIAVNDLSDENYISTENMLPNKSGIVKASTLPNLQLTPAYQENDVLISNIRPYFRKIWQAEYCGGCSNDVLVLRAKKSVNPKFLYYVLSEDKFFDYATATSKGTKMPRGDKTAIMKYEVPEFSETEQEKIANILFPIDEKIAINSATNNNLEQQAMALFKQKIIKNCDNNKNGTIGEYCSVKSGYAFKGTWWQDNGVKVIKIKTIDNDSINFNDCSYVSNDKIEFAKDFIVQGGDLLIAMTGATIGKFAIIPKVNEPLLVNQRVGKFFLGSEPLNRLPFLYCSLKQQDVITEIINRGQGSAQPNISSSDIMTTPIYLPSKYFVDEFNELCKPIFETLITNKYENEQLAKLRDTLLPKLMSGEIDVSNVDISTDKLSFSCLNVLIEF